MVSKAVSTNTSTLLDTKLVYWLTNLVLHVLALESKLVALHVDDLLGLFALDVIKLTETLVFGAWPENV